MHVARPLVKQAADAFKDALAADAGLLLHLACADHTTTVNFDATMSPLPPSLRLCATDSTQSAPGLRLHRSSVARKKEGVSLHAETRTHACTSTNPLAG